MRMECVPFFKFFVHCVVQLLSCRVNTRADELEAKCADLSSQLDAARGSSEALSTQLLEAKSTVSELQVRVFACCTLVLELLAHHMCGVGPG